MMKPHSVHHVAIVVRDLEKSRRFYRDVLMLEEIERPEFPFPGAWFQVGTQQVHLIVHTSSTFRGDKDLDTRDLHFAMRVDNFGEALEFLRSKGYREDAADDFHRMIVQPHATAGFPQIFILDPDRNIVEINSEAL